MALQPVDFQQHIKTVLTAINVAADQGVLLDATVSGANTYTTLRQRIKNNIDAKAGVEFQQVGSRILVGLDSGNTIGVLTDARLNGLTTVAQVRGLCTADDGQLGSTYRQLLPQ